MCGLLVIGVQSIQGLERSVSYGISCSEYLSLGHLQEILVEHWSLQKVKFVIERYIAVKCTFIFEQEVAPLAAGTGASEHAHLHLIGGRYQNHFLPLREPTDRLAANAREVLPHRDGDLAVGVLPGYDCARVIVPHELQGEVGHSKLDRLSRTGLYDPRSVRRAAVGLFGGHAGYDTRGLCQLYLFLVAVGGLRGDYCEQDMEQIIPIGHYRWQSWSPVEQCLPFCGTDTRTVHSLVHRQALGSAS